MTGFGYGLFGEGLFGVGGNSFTLWDFPAYREEDYEWEPVWGDRDYDYGLAKDGTPNPPPCIIDGTPLNACTHS